VDPALVYWGSVEQGIVVYDVVQ